MDKVAQTFDEWAEGGRDELMEKEHSRSVTRILAGIRWKDSFSFLDVGCGNGWVVRTVAQRKQCISSVGIDKSRQMIKRAKKLTTSTKEEYLHADIESLDVEKRFDYVFAMESIYYSESVDVTLRKIFGLLKNGGVFFCGTDFYTENTATTNWPKMVGLNMHLYSKKEWRTLFADAGFRPRTRQIKDAQSRKKWKRESGTLFIIGQK